MGTSGSKRYEEETRRPSASLVRLTLGEGDSDAPRQGQHLVGPWNGRDGVVGPPAGGDEIAAAQRRVGHSEPRDGQ